MPFPLDISFPSILSNGKGIFLELASSIKLELPDNAPAELWKELTIIRGHGLSVLLHAPYSSILTQILTNCSS